MSSLASFLPIAHTLADLARPIARKYFRQPLTVQTKRDASPVTIADQEIEDAMVQYLRRNCPDHGILGEELGAHNPEAAWTWVLDPIDGTKSFVMGRPTFARARRGSPTWHHRSAHLGRALGGVHGRADDIQRPALPCALRHFTSRRRYLVYHHTRHV
jgi:hypothetical protein